MHEVFLVAPFCSLISVYSCTNRSKYDVNNLVDAQRVVPDAGVSLPADWLGCSGQDNNLVQNEVGEVGTTIPTIGFNVETVEHGGAKLTIWDVDGCDKIRPLWRHYYQNTQALIFILDCNDSQRFGMPIQRAEVYVRLAEQHTRLHLRADEAMQLFRDTITADELLDATLLIFFNKMVLVTASRITSTREKFLAVNDTILRGRTYHIQPCSAPSGDGLIAGFDWLTAALLHKPSKPATAAAPEPTEKDR